MDQHAIGSALTTGQELVDGAGNKIKLPKLPTTVVSIALDLEHPQRPGVISKKNVSRAHEHLGIHIPRDWMKPRKRTPAVRHTGDILRNLPLG
jgi:hypothetical protein